MGLNLNDGYVELNEHFGHAIEIGRYGSGDRPQNIVIECVTCGEVLVDFERPPDMECINCNELITQERDDPWFHTETGEERCWENRDDFAAPRAGVG